MDFGYNIRYTITVAQGKTGFQPASSRGITNIELYGTV